MDRVVQFGACKVTDRSTLTTAIANYTVRAPVDIYLIRSGTNLVLTTTFTASASPSSTINASVARGRQEQEKLCNSIGLMPF